MDATSYTGLTRQSGLMRELSVIANNIANANTTGYRQEGVVFSEYVRAVKGGPSLSMAAGHARMTSLAQGGMNQTGGPLDVAIDGEGFFLIETPQGTRLTRAGHFMPNAQGDLVTADGFAVLDAGGAPLFVPTDASGIRIAPDGTLSAGDQLLGQLGIVRPDEEAQLSREDGIYFNLTSGTYVPADTAQVRQGFLERSNVDTLSQVARMIEVQRAYEMGQSFSDAENERLRSAITTLLK